MDVSSLVTGGAGFIGSHVAAELLKLGHKVVVLDDMSGGSVSNVPELAILEQGSILDVEKVAKLFQRYKFDYVYHLAAYAAEGLSHFIKNFNHQNNLIGSVNVINASVNHDVKCFVFTSSIAVYGAGQVPMSETTIPIPEDSYGIAKYAVELELAATYRMFGMDYIIFRPHNVYGEHQNIGDIYRNVIGIFMNQIMQGKPMTIFGNGNQVRAFSYIADVAPYIARAVEIPETRRQVFNVGADTPYTVNYLAELVAKTMGVKPEIVYLPGRNEVGEVYASHEKMASVFGQGARVPLEEGLRRMAAWVNRVGRQRGHHFNRIEIVKGLPPSWVE